MGSRLSRWRGLVGVGWRRVHHRLGPGGNRQTLICVLGIALPVALLLLVASVSLGLAADPAAGGDADYWVVPEGASSAVTNVESPQLGGVHPAAERVSEREDVVHASPMLIEFVRVGGPNAERVHVLAIGVIPSGRPARIAPLATDGLRSGDPYYGDGEYDGTWTGEAVLSESAATELGAEPGTDLTIRGTDRSLTVVGVESPKSAGLAQLPIVVVHLSELQAITGASDGDTADQLVVVAPQATTSTERALESLYPQTTLETRGGMLAERGSDSRLPAAVSLAALLVVLTTGTLLVSTAFGFELAADSRGRELLSALGVSGRSRALIIGTEIVVVSLYGAASSLVIWAVGVLVANRITVARVGAPVAEFDLRFVGYAVGIALLIGLLSLPYLFVVDWRAGGEVTLS